MSFYVLGAVITPRRAFLNDHLDYSWQSWQLTLIPCQLLGNEALT